ncbi:hypothetical protein NIES4071_109690 (plasmid) [Calothrix sp. NIES-4071]|nr:hypothetical protein NIES4071_109690 [Calothrix sp. NIES-4071]BAZ65223.1 hypothetical protein NIES4105_109560 [Calothrix sp. NIES-4105]
MENLQHDQMSKKTTIVLPDVIYEDLMRWAESEGRPTANLASFLIEQSVRAKFSNKYPPPATGKGNE